MEIFLLYVGFSLLSLLYVLRDRLPEKIDYLVVLSGGTKQLTRWRLDKAIQLKARYPNAKVIISGRDHASFMSEYLAGRSTHGFLVQDRSTNTYEDAFFTQPLVKVGDVLALVTNQAHQRRAYHTFKSVLPNNTILNSPTQDLFTFLSPLSPTGWIAVIVNAYKDYKYNRKII